LQTQYVPVSMVEQQTGRQVLLAAQGAWSNSRQMTLVPSWQQLTAAAPGQHSTLQPPTAALLQAAETSDWGHRTALLVSSDPSVTVTAGEHQRSIFPVELSADVYDTVSVVSDGWSNSKRHQTGQVQSQNGSHKPLFTLQVPSTSFLLPMHQCESGLGRKSHWNIELGVTKRLLVTWLRE